MMMDAPSYDVDAKEEEEMVLTENNSENIRNYVNNLM
jgi:hypothetical protein